MMKRLDRRNFLTCAAAGLGTLATASLAPATFFRRPTYLPATPPVIAPVPVVPVNLAFEVGSGVTPVEAVRVLQGYLALTLSPEYAELARIVQPLPRPSTTFHNQFLSNYVLPRPLGATQSRYGFFVGINEVVQADGQAVIRPQQDLNFYELRRLLHPAELSQFGVVLSPTGTRNATTPTDLESFYRVARTYYGIPNPETLTVLYTRLFTNGRNSFVGYLASRGPEPMRSPFKDLLLDAVPVF